MKQLASNGKKRITDGGIEGSLKARLIKAPNIIRNNGTDAYEAIMTATSHLPITIRDDVQGDMFVAVTEGRLKIKDVSNRVRQFAAARNRADRNSVLNPWGHLSLDKPLNGDTDSTFMDIIRDDQRLWG
jgi:hypothetical protein